jgi:hypothetical protein
MTLSIRLLQAACVFAVLASVAGATWWLYATAVRADWLGVAIGAAGVLCALTWAAGVILIDRGLRRVHRRRTAE